jgi:hypothetical protein
VIPDQLDKTTCSISYCMHIPVSAVSQHHKPIKLYKNSSNGRLPLSPSRQMLLLLFFFSISRHIYEGNCGYSYFSRNSDIILFCGVLSLLTSFCRLAQEHRGAPEVLSWGANGSYGFIHQLFVAKHCTFDINEHFFLHSIIGHAAVGFRNDYVLIKSLWIDDSYHTHNIRG